MASGGIDAPAALDTALCAVPKMSTPRYLMHQPRSCLVRQVQVSSLDSGIVRIIASARNVRDWPFVKFESNVCLANCFTN